MRTACVLGIVGLASVHNARADSREGKYALDVLPEPYGWVLVGDHRLPSCGYRTSSIWARLGRLAVEYTHTEDPGEPAKNDVLVNNKPWIFLGFTDGPNPPARAREPGSAGPIVEIWFRGDRQTGHADGTLQVMLANDFVPYCADMRSLSGVYAPRSAPTHP